MIVNNFSAYATTEVPIGTIKGQGPLAELLNTLSGVVNLFNKVISNIVGILTIVAGLWFIFQFMLGAFSYLTSGGDKARIEEAQKKITSALIGLVIVVAAIFLIDLVGSLLGLKILRPGDFIRDLWLGISFIVI